MIEIYVGPVGSGKSFHALDRAWSKVRAVTNNLVVANFPIKFKPKEVKRGLDKRWIYLDDDDLTPDNLIKLSFERGFYGREGYALLVIDEAGLYFNARDWQVSGDVRKSWIKFFAQSRKFGYDVVLIAQDVRMIDRQIRSIAEYTVKHVKLRNYKWFALIPWQIFACVSYWSGGSFRGTIQFLPFKPWVAKRYDTMRMFRISDDLQEMFNKYNVLHDTVQSPSKLKKILPSLFNF